MVENSSVLNRLQQKFLGIGYSGGGKTPSSRIENVGLLTRIKRCLENANAPSWYDSEPLSMPFFFSLAPFHQPDRHCHVGR